MTELNKECQDILEEAKLLGAIAGTMMATNTLRDNGNEPSTEEIRIILRNFLTTFKVDAKNLDVIFSRLDTRLVLMGFPSLSRKFHIGDPK